MKTFLKIIGLLSMFSTGFAATPEQFQDSQKLLNCRLAVQFGRGYNDFKIANASGQCSNKCSDYTDNATIGFNDLAVAGYSCSALYTPQSEGTFGRINIKIKSPSGGISSSFIKIGTKDKVDQPNMNLNVDEAMCICKLE